MVDRGNDLSDRLETESFNGLNIAHSMKSTMEDAVQKLPVNNPQYLVVVHSQNVIEWNSICHL